MRIFFSESFNPDPDTLAQKIVRAVAGVPPGVLQTQIKWERGRVVVFTLPNATFDQHDDVIRALLQLDPGAEIRTSKAHFHGLTDFEAQYKATSES